MGRTNSYFDKILNILSLLGVIFMFTYLFTVWPDLPQTVPTHFDFWGKPDAFGGKGNMLILPFIAFGIYIMFTVINRFPNAFNYPENITTEQKQHIYVNSCRMIGWLNLQMVYFFLYGTWETTQIALGIKTQLATYALFIFLILMTVTILYYIIRNYKIAKRVKENGAP